MIINQCTCGCGAEIAAGKRFVFGHHWRGVKRGRPWNKERSYLIAKRTTYANKGAWNKALIRLYGNGCQRCGWAEATCDAHHIIPKSQGGAFTLDNGVLLCPNCHRLMHERPDIRETLTALKAAAIPVGLSY